MTGKSLCESMEVFVKFLLLNIRVSLSALTLNKSLNFIVFQL